MKLPALVRHYQIGGSSRKEVVHACDAANSWFSAHCVAVSLTAAAGDTSPHRSAFVRSNGVKLHYLEWSGGKRGVLLMLAGLGNDAHVFDSFAVRFTDKYRVLALTRRGYGESDRPREH